MCVEDALKRKKNVLVNNLTRGEIYDLQSHSEIDPYSSLEEIFSSDTEPEEPPSPPIKKEVHNKTVNSDTDSEESMPMYHMCERIVKRKHFTDCPQRQSSENINYYKMDLGLESWSPKRKSKPKPKPVPSEPSHS